MSTVRLSEPCWQVDLPEITPLRGRDPPPTSRLHWLPQAELGILTHHGGVRCASTPGLIVEQWRGSSGTAGFCWELPVIWRGLLWFPISPHGGSLRASLMLGFLQHRLPVCVWVCCLHHNTPSVLQTLFPLPQLQNKCRTFISEDHLVGTCNF